MTPKGFYVKYIIAWPPLSKAEVPLALQCLERAQQHRLARRLSSKRQEGIEGAERLRADAPVRHQVGIVLAVAIERRQRPLQEGDRDRRAHVGAGVEQLGGDARASLCDLVEARPKPVQPPVDRRRFFARELPHRAAVTIRSRHCLGDSETGRPAPVVGIGDIATLALDKRFDQRIHIHRVIHPLSPSESRC